MNEYMLNDDWLTFENVVDPKKLTILYDNIVKLYNDTAMKHRRQFIDFVVKYIDSNAQNLYIMAPYEHVLFLERHEKALMNIFGIEKEQIRECVKKCKVIAGKWKTLNNPIYHMLTALAMIYSGSDDKLTVNARLCSILMISLKFYSAKQLSKWPNNPDRKVMEYTINNLSNKFSIKNEKTVFGIIKKVAEDNYNTIGVRLYKDHYDSDWLYYITNVSTRINNILDNINREYENNLKNKNYMNENEETYDNPENNETTIKVLSNVSADVITLTNKVYKRIKGSEIDPVKLSDATTITKISVNSVKNTLEELIFNETDSLKKVITLILQIFFSDTKNTAERVKSRYFVVYCMNIYRISNTKNPLINELKDILDSWLYKYGAKYTKLARESTLINFRKAIYIYLVDCIVDFS